MPEIYETVIEMHQLQRGDVVVESHMIPRDAIVVSATVKRVRTEVTVRVDGDHMTYRPQNDDMVRVQRERATEDEILEQDVAGMRRWIISTIQKYIDAKEAFALCAADDPEYAINWHADVVSTKHLAILANRVAAIYGVRGDMMSAVEKVAENATMKVIDAARYGYSNSTSLASNLCKALEVAAYGKFLDEFRVVNLLKRAGS